MVTIRSLWSIFAVAMVLLSADGVFAQAYPNKPIRILTGSAGGSNDVIARLIASGISEPLGQQVVVENRGSNTIAAPQVAQSTPDGYTLLSAGDIIWLAPLLRGNSDAIREFSPISLLANSPNVVAVHPSLPVKSIKDLIALAKAHPGALNYATATNGGIDHLAGALFNKLASVNLTQIPYKGGSPSIVGVMSGEAQLTFQSTALVLPQAKAGKLRALAVTSAQPSALTPGLPTVAAAGVPGYEIGGTDGIYAPAKTPPAVINRLNEVIVRFLNTPDAKAKYLALGGEVIASSPEEHAAFLKSRIATIGQLVKEAGIKGD